METVSYEHHGTEVSVQKHLKGKHREHCLCWQRCRLFYPGDKDRNCEIAQANYEFCVKFNVVLPVWECPEYCTRQSDLM